MILFSRSTRFVTGRCALRGGSRQRDSTRDPTAPASTRILSGPTLPSCRRGCADDVAIARVYGEIDAALARAGQRLADADLQIAARRSITASNS